MSLVYRLMGAIAILNQALSRIRINFIPLNWAAMAILGMAVIVSLGSLLESTSNSKKPRVVSVADVLSHHTGQDYVTVKGLIAPQDGYSEKAGDGTTNNWEPMVDITGKRVFLTELHGTPDKGKPHMVSVTGMLEPMGEDLESKVKQDGGKIEDFPVDTERVLIEGNAPGDVTAIGIGAAVAGVLLALFLITFAQRYVVFQKVKPRYSGLAVAAPDTSVVSAPISVRVTGEFTLEARNSRRFFYVPAGVTFLENGAMAFVSNIDASNRFMGFKVNNLAGVWAAVIQPGSLNCPEQGLLYVGFAAKPSLRIQYVDGWTRLRQSAILTFPDDAQRQRSFEHFESMRLAPVVV